MVVTNMHFKSTADPIRLHIATAIDHFVMASTSLSIEPR